MILHKCFYEQLDGLDLEHEFCIFFGYANIFYFNVLYRMGGRGLSKFGKFLIILHKSFSEQFVDSNIDTDFGI